MTSSDHIKVMICEDDVENLEFVVEFLEDEFTLLVADNGDHAIQLAQGERPDVVLMDLKLDLWTPPTTGFDLTVKLRELPEMQGVPIWAVSARSLDHERQRALNAGCDDLITKPFEFDDLIARLHKIGES